MRVKVTKYGLDYANKIAAAIVNSELLSLDVPPLENDFGGGSVSADGIRVTSLLAPNYNYRLIEPNTLVWSMSGGHLTVEGHYKGSVKVLFAPISGSGPFKATANDLQLTVRVLLNTDQSRPKVDVIDCQSNLNGVHLEIGGGIVGWIMNRLEDQIASRLTPKLQALVCERVTDFIEKDVNKKLQTIPIIVKLDDSTQLDYGLMAAPAVSSDSLELRHKGEVISADGSALPFRMFKESFDESDIATNNSRMLLIAVSDRMFNSYLYHSFYSGSRSLVVDKVTSPERAKFLAAQCSATEMCIGNYLADYRQAYGNSTLSAILELTDPAIVEIVDGIGQCKANGSISLLADGRAILTVNVSAEVALSVRVDSQVEGTLLKGLISFNSLIVSSAGQSEIASLNDPFLMDYIVDTAKLVVEAEMNAILGAGTPIPMPRGTNLTNAETIFVRNQLLLFCDFEYSPGK
uniref:Lipid-binding serum glycoprotein C-terminal domain-containing protein n=1 Tax=Plectus sambesii TaxID=2011161 RepID=A0A914UV11_9BILA